MIDERLSKGLLLAAVFMLFVILAPGVVQAGPGGKLSAGMTLPEFKLPAPGAAEEATYLGVKGGEPFALSQVTGKMVIFDVLDVF